jgi:copper homeostasis protein
MLEKHGHREWRTRPAVLKTFILRVCMASRVLLEICVESVSLAVAAERGGADRVEFCSDLSCGGVTADATLMRAVRQQVRIPIYVMIRPRPGDFCYSEREFETMKRDIALAKEIGFSGIVLGVLDPSRHVDCVRTLALVELANPLRVTFHRAFDQSPDPTAALEAVIETGAKRILTSGGAANSVDGLISLASLVELAGNRIVIMPGGGVRPENVESILRTTGAREIHTSLDGTRSKSSKTTGHDVKLSPDLPASLFEERVRKFKAVMDRVSSAPIRQPSG